MGTEPISKFFDRRACCRLDGGRSKPPRFARASKALLAALERVGIRGRSILELGSGTGELSVALLRGGASAVTAFDLSPRSVEHARDRARREGVADRARFEVGDAATAELGPHDVVVLDKVICCYPHAAELVRNSSNAALWLYAMTLPVSRGALGLGSRAFIGAENAWRRLTRDPFRAYVHDVPRIESTLREQGFRPVERSVKVPWHVGVYERRGS